jgi:catechol 2,3-dioxygenase-like lactoylglutathione lyase family enzyme
MAPDASLLPQIHHTGFTVSDLERSISFYTEHLGCAVVVRHERRGGYIAELMGVGDAHVKLAQLRVPGAPHILELMAFVHPPPVSGAMGPCVIGAAHVCFDVEDLIAVHARMVAAGVPSVGAPVPMDSGPNAGGSSVYVLDPDGIIVQLRETPLRPEPPGSPRLTSL